MSTIRASTFFCVLAILAAGCGESPVRPVTGSNVTGTWDGRFEGTVQSRNTSQTDTFVMELRQSGSSVTGTLRFSGLDLAVAVAGEVDGTIFTYTARAFLSPACEAVVRAETTVDVAGARFSGAQTQSTCEGTAVGHVSAMRR
jgi:hypothetical protein